MQSVAVDAPRQGCRLAGTAAALPLGASMQQAAARPCRGPPQCSAASPSTAYLGGMAYTDHVVHICQRVLEHLRPNRRHKDAAQHAISGHASRAVLGGGEGAGGVPRRTSAAAKGLDQQPCPAQLRPAPSLPC